MLSNQYNNNMWIWNTFRFNLKHLTLFLIGFTDFLVNGVVDTWSLRLTIDTDLIKEIYILVFGIVMLISIQLLVDLYVDRSCLSWTLYQMDRPEFVYWSWPWRS